MTLNANASGSGTLTYSWRVVSTTLPASVSISLSSATAQNPTFSVPTVTDTSGPFGQTPRAVFAVSALLAMGSWTPLLRLLYDANLPPSVRYPEKFLLMGAYVALAWGCLVLEDLPAGDRKAARATLIALISAGVVAAGVYAWTFHPSYDESVSGP